jgi:hypothetical protein
MASGRVGKPGNPLHNTNIEDGVVTSKQNSLDETASGTVEEKHQEKTSFNDIETQIPTPKILPTRFKIEDNPQPSSNKGPASCSICTEDFLHGENIRLLPCTHIYHRRCIDPWLLDFAGTCPLW